MQKPNISLVIAIYSFQEKNRAHDVTFPTQKINIVASRIALDTPTKVFVLHPYFPLALDKLSTREQLENHFVGYNIKNIFIS